MSKLEEKNEFLRQPDTVKILIRFYEAANNDPWGVPNRVTDISEHLAENYGIPKEVATEKIFSLCRYGMISDNGIPFNTSDQNLILSHEGIDYVMTHLIK